MKTYKSIHSAPSKIFYAFLNCKFIYQVINKNWLIKMISHKSLSRVGWLSGGSACGSDGGSSGSWGCGSRWSLSCSSCCTSVSSCRYRCGWHSLRLVLPSSALCPLLRSPLLWSAPLFTAMWSIMGSCVWSIVPMWPISAMRSPFAFASLVSILTAGLLIGASCGWGCRGSSGARCGRGSCARWLQVHSNR